MINQMKTQVIYCECTLRGILAKLLPKRESWSSRLVPTWLMSVWRLLVICKTDHNNLCCPLAVIWVFWWETPLDSQFNCISPVPKRIQLQPTIVWGESGCYTWCGTVRQTGSHWPQPKIRQTHDTYLRPCTVQCKSWSLSQVWARF